MTSSTQPQCCFACLAGNLGNTRFACSNPSCSCHQLPNPEDDGPNAVGNQPRQEWEEGLKDAYYGDFSTYDMIDVKYEDVKDFISTTLASERKALLEELLREMPKEYAGDLSLMELFQAKDIGYNKALATIKSLIEKKLHEI